MSDERKWYKIRGFVMFLSKPTVQVLRSAGLQDVMEEMEGELFKPKMDTISYEQAVEWATGGKNGQLNLDDLFKYM